MTRSITIRDVPDETCDELSTRAAATGRSLQEYLRNRLIELASQPDPEAFMIRVRDRKARTGTMLSAEQIVRYREEDRR